MTRTLRGNGFYYSTQFTASQNPISEGSLWRGGKTDALDWQDIRTTPGKAFGNQTGSSGVYDDSVSLLTGPWGPDHEVQGTIFSSVTAAAYYAEVELHLRGTLASHSIQTYEVLFSVNPSARTQGSYCEIAKWFGSQGGATFNGQSLTGQIAITAPVTGDIVRARIVGNTISAYINGVLVASIADSVGLSGTAPYVTGNPGMGHWLHNNGATGDVTTYGLSQFSAQTLISRQSAASRSVATTRGIAA